MDLTGRQWHLAARPTKIDDVYGGNSSSIDTMLKPFVKMHAKDDKWPRGILLMGKVGGGKTTVAKIIAQTMVCKHLDADGNPCGECPDCKAIIEEKWNRDVKLIDASNLKSDGQTSIEAMQSLIAESKALPFFGGKRKVIIIDEIQELMRGTMKAAINALLKELERENGRTCWIFTSMDELKQTGKNVETELGNGTGYGSSGQSGFLRRVTQFKFNAINNSDLLKYMFSFAHKHEYQGKLLWDYMLENGGKEFCTNGLMAIAESANGSIGTATKNLQQVVESKVFEPSKIGLTLGVIPEVALLDTVMSIASNSKDDNAFIQISSINDSNFATVYQLMLSEIRKAEQVRVFNRIGNIKFKDGGAEFKTINEKTAGPELASFNRAKTLYSSPNYAKLKATLFELSKEGYFTCDLFRAKLLDCYS